jgi:hypothetical protein
MNERKQVIQLLNSSNPDSVRLGYELSEQFAPDVREVIDKIVEPYRRDGIVGVWDNMADEVLNNLTLFENKTRNYIGIYGFFDKFTFLLE